MGNFIPEPTSEQGKEATEKAERTVRELCESCGATFPKIVKELCSIAFSDMRNYVTVAEGGEIQAIPFNQIVKKKTKVIRKLKENTKITESSDGARLFKESRVEFELYDKPDALKYLCKLQGYEPAQQTQISGPGGGPIEHKLYDFDPSKFPKEKTEGGNGGE